MHACRNETHNGGAGFCWVLLILIGVYALPATEGWWGNTDWVGTAFGSSLDNKSSSIGECSSSTRILECAWTSSNDSWQMYHVGRTVSGNQQRSDMKNIRFVLAHWKEGKWNWHKKNFIAYCILAFVIFVVVMTVVVLRNNSPWVLSSFRSKH